MNNVNDTYFDGHYKDIWRAIIPEELTSKEVDFIISYFNLQPGSKVLDLMCGYGRHALALARKGMKVTAVDNLQIYIDEVSAQANKDNLPVKAVAHDVLRFKPDAIYDLVICMGNSISFFNPTDTRQILETISSHLKRDGSLLINTWSLAETAFRTFSERSWANIGELKCLNDSKLLFYPTRIETEATIIDQQGKIEKKLGVDYIYSVNEMENLFTAAGLELKEIFSVPGKKKFAVGDPRAYIIAKKK